MSVQALTWVLDHSKAKLADRLVLLSIANHANATGGDAFPSQATIAKEAGITARQVTRCTARLRDLGELDWVKGGSQYGTNLYEMVAMGTDNMSVPDVVDVGRGTDIHDIKAAGNVGRTVLRTNRPSIRPNATDDFSEAVQRLCSTMADLVAEGGDPKPTVSRRWLEECDRLIRIDGREPQLIEDVMRWAMADDFWSGNILSMPKLRKQFTTLRKQMGRKQGADVTSIADRLTKRQEAREARESR